MSGVIEDLDLLLKDFLGEDREGEDRVSRCRRGRQRRRATGALVYGRFLDPEPRKAFFEAYKEIESLWEILSPSPELRDHIATFKRLAQLYAAVRNAYAEKVGFVADLAYKTRRLVEQNATQEGLGLLTKTVTFDVKTLEGASRRARARTKERSSTSCGVAEGDRRGIRCRAGAADAEGSGRAHPEGSGEPQHDGSRRHGAAGGAGKREGRGDQGGKGERPVDPCLRRLLDAEGRRGAAKGRRFRHGSRRRTRRRVVRFPNAKVNADERRKLRAALYRPLLGLDKEERGRVVDIVLRILLDGDYDADG